MNWEGIPLGGRFRYLLFLSLGVVLGPACNPKDKPINKPENVLAAAPTSLALVNVTSARADLTWIDNSDNEFEFHILRSDDPPGTYVQVGTAVKNSQSFTDYGLLPATVYHYQVVAWNSKGDSPPTNSLPVTTTALSWEAPVSGGPVPGRANHSAVYDASTSPPRMLVYGGFDANTGLFSNELWSLPLPTNAAPGVWANPSTLGATVPGLLGHTAVIDPVRNQMVVFGGQYFDASFNLLNSNEVYILDLATLSWSNPAPSGTRPSARAFHVAAYDAPRQQMIVHGGSDGTFELSETYVLDLKSLTVPAWSGPLTGIRPAHRQQHTAITDAQHDQVIIFGGIDNDPADNSPLSQDSWSLSLTPSLLWTPMVFTGTPGMTSGQSAIYDTANRRMLIFGGQNTTNPVILNNVIWEMTLDQTPAWRMLAPANAPTARYGHSAVYDSGFGRMVIYGGFNAGLLVFDDYIAIKL